MSTFAKATVDKAISIVVPAYNEAAYLPRLLDTIDAARARFTGGRDAIEVIVADNGSTDDTAALARSRGCLVAPVNRRSRWPRARSRPTSRNGGAAIDTFNAIATTIASAA